MNVIMIADDSAANAWLIRAVEQSIPLRAIIRPDWDSVRPSAAGTSSSGARARVSAAERIVRRLRARYFDRIERLATARLATALFPDGHTPVPSTSVITVPSWDINGEATQRHIRALAPDLIIVSGAPILKPAIFSAATMGTVNLHFGISPDYRGMHTLSTPWQAGDYANVGATIHYIDDGIDTGPVLCRVYPALTAADDLVTAEAAIVKDVASALCAFLHWMTARAEQAPAPGRRFTETGRLVRFHDRSIRAHLAARVRTALGGRAPTRPARVEIFYRDATN